MFTAQDQVKVAAVARCSRLAGRLALTKRAVGPNPYLLDAFNGLPQLSIKGWHPSPPSTLGEHLGATGRGYLNLAGNLGRTVFTGHRGQPGILGNYWNKLTDVGPEMLRGNMPWKAPAGSPLSRSWHELLSTKPLSAPWQWGGAERGKAMSDAASLGGYVTQPFIRGYYGLKSLFNQPISKPIQFPGQP